LRLQRYIFVLLLRNFLVLVVVVTGLLLLMGTVEGLRRLQGHSVGLLLSRLPYMLPRMLGYSIPLSILLATLITFGRLSADNELLAIRMAGIHPVHTIMPAILLGLLLAIGMLYLNGSVTPHANIAVRAITKDDFRRFLANLSETSATTFSNDRFDLTWASVDDDNALVDVHFDLRPEDETPIRGRAGRAFIRKDDGRGVLEFEFRDSDIVIGEGQDKIEADSKRVAYPYESLFEVEADPTDREHLSTRDLAYLIAREPALGRPEKSMLIRRYRVEFWNRCFLALSCLAFALSGSPVGILFRRGSFIGSAVVALALAFGVFYPLQEAGRSLAYQGVLAPALALALPDLVLSFIGLCLMARIFSR
jgi:lipopolysaccharide export LptBFGC system permease protein LptF